MEDQMQLETSSSMDSLDTDAMHRQIEDVESLLRFCKQGGPQASPLEAETLLNQCFFYLEDRLKQIVSEASSIASSFGPEDSGAFLNSLKEEHSAMQMERNKVSEEIEFLTKSIMAASNTLESEVDWLKSSLHMQLLQGLDMGQCVRSICTENPLTIENGHVDHKLKMMDLQSRIEEKKMLFKSLQYLDCELNKFNTIEQIEDSLSSIKVTEFGTNCIRLSLKTFLPKVECSNQISEDAFESSELSHELLIKVMDGNLKPAKVEIFPNDINIADILDAAKTFRQLVHQTSLEWLVCKVQERIILTTLRRSAVNNVRHSVEYIDRDETIVAHLSGEVDAFLQPSQGWPLIDSPLKLKSLKYDDNLTKKRISLDFICKVQEALNSLDADRKANLCVILDTIDAALMVATAHLS